MALRWGNSIGERAKLNTVLRDWATARKGSWKEAQKVRTSLSSFHILTWGSNWALCALP